MADRDLPTAALPIDRRRLTVADQAMAAIVVWMALARGPDKDWLELFRAELADLLPEVDRNHPQLAALVKIAERMAGGAPWVGYDGELAVSRFLLMRAVLAAQAARDAAGRDPTLAKGETA